MTDLTSRPRARSGIPRDAFADDDARLIAAPLDEPERFSELFDRHAPAIHQYIGRRLGRNAADDVMAEDRVLRARRGRLTRRLADAGIAATEDVALVVSGTQPAGPAIDLPGRPAPWRDCGPATAVASCTAWLHAGGQAESRPSAPSGMSRRACAHAPASTCRHGRRSCGCRVSAISKAPVRSFSSWLKTTHRIKATRMAR